MRYPSATLRSAAAAAAAWLACTAAAAATLTPVASFGSNPGNLRMFKYVPDNVLAAPPLVVALHGCLQSAKSFDDETGWVRLADRLGFVLLLPEQKGFSLPSAGLTFTLPTFDFNNQLGCFNWFLPGDITRGQGEAASIKRMVDKMKADHHVDPKQVYVMGLSAGGAMAAAMLAAYPEVFVGGAVVAGLPYRCASNSLEAQNACMRSGKDLSPAAWGDRVRQASNHTGPWPRVSIWHGSADQTVNPVNLRELVEQWTNVHGIDQTPDEQGSVHGHAHKSYKDAAGNTLVESYEIAGMDHGIPVDPGNAADQCGVAGNWVLDKNICASLFIAKFWGLDAAQ